MHSFSVEKKLRSKLSKLYKKDRIVYKRIISKIKEIVSNKSIEHYKNLRKPLNEFKRVHIMKSFVLIFKYEKSKDCVLFYDFDHHDKIYK